MRDTTIKISEFRVELVKEKIRVEIRYSRNGFQILVRTNTAPLMCRLHELDVTNEMAEELIERQPSLLFVGKSIGEDYVQVYPNISG